MFDFRYAWGRGRKDKSVLLVLSLFSLTPELYLINYIKISQHKTVLPVTEGPCWGPCSLVLSRLRLQIGPRWSV